MHYKKFRSTFQPFYSALLLINRPRNLHKPSVYQGKESIISLFYRMKSGGFSSCHTQSLSNFKSSALTINQQQEGICTMTDINSTISKEDNESFLRKVPDSIYKTRDPLIQEGASPCS